MNLLQASRQVFREADLGVVWRTLADRSTAPDEAARSLEALEVGPPQTLTLTLDRPRRVDLELQSFIVAAGSATLGRGYLVRDVTQRAQVERLKSSILSTVSHELRAPLAAIKGFASSLLRQDVEWDPANRRDFIEQIDGEADRLTVLVRNLLDMSRLDAGTLRLDREWCDLSDLLMDVLDRMGTVTADRATDLAVADARVLAFVDRDFLERVIWNLVDNAVKYSPAGTPVTLGVARDTEEVKLIVADRGEGIPPQEHGRIFERFHRGSDARVAGVGLGLAICQGIVEAHGGKIGVEDRPGGGSIFVVRLPGGVPEDLGRLRPFDPTRDGAA